MATLLSPTNVVCEVDSIVVRDDGEALGGSEPYLWSVFFKIDGDSVIAKIDINNQGVTLTLDGDPTVTSPHFRCFSMYSVGQCARHRLGKGAA
jgi:hypothetical protein